MKLSRRCEVVLNGVSVPHDFGILQPGDRSNHLVLNVAWQAGRNPVAVNFERVSAFRFKEELVRLLLRKPDDLILDRWAVPRPCRVDLSAVHRGAAEICPDQIVNLFIGRSEPATNLLLLDLIRHERKRLRIVVSGLRFKLRVINRSTIQPSWRSGLKTFKLKTQFSETLRQRIRRALSGAAAFRLRFARVHDCLQESPCRYNGRSDSVKSITANSHSSNPALFDDQTFNHFLAKRQILLLLDPQLHPELVSLFVRLSPRTVHRRAFATIQHAELNSSLVDTASHFAAKRVDLPNDLPLRHASDRRVAAHLPDRVAVHRQQNRASSQSSRSQRRLSAGMPRPNYRNVKVVNR